MIRSFADRETELIYHGYQSRRLPPNIQPAAHRKLLAIAAAATLEDLRQPPSHRLEKLRGDRRNQWSIRINDQWRINEIVLGKRSITADTDLRLGRYFGMSEGFFLRLQIDHDVRLRKRQLGAELDRIKPRKAA